MPEQSSTTIERPRVAPQSGERISMAERVWQATDSVVHTRLNEAHAQLKEGEGQLTPEGLAKLAYANHVRHMEQADTDEMTTTELTANQIALAMLESPLAAKADKDQQTNPARNPHDRAKRVGSLIQFNHDLAATLSHMSPNMIADFPQKLLERTHKLFGDKLRLPTFDRQDFNRIVAGVSREVAFSRALQGLLPEGWKLRHATVREDLIGIDIVVDTPDGPINIDTKTSGAFEKALASLWADHRISQAEYDAALEDRFVQITTNDGRDMRAVYVLDADSLGEVRNFEYDNPDNVLDFVEERHQEMRAPKLRELGKNAIVS